MKLSKEHIERLFEFVESKYVEYYDVQVEIVDHLATAIEEKTEEDPDKKFEEALNEVYRSFGVMGFSSLLEDKQDAMSKERMRLWWHEFKTWFSWPKIALTALILGGVYFFSEAGYARHIAYGFQFWIIALFGYYLHHLWRVKREFTQQKKKQSLLLLQSGMMIGLLTVPIITPFISNLIDNFNYDFTQPVESPSWYLALLIGLLTIVYMAFIQVEKRMFKKAKDLYPELFTVSA